MNDVLRKERERELHNQRFGAEHDIRQPFSKWYAATKWYAALADGSRAQNQMVRHLGFGAKVLEYGCSDGVISVVYDRLPQNAAYFHGIDLKWTPAYLLHRFVETPGRRLIH
jgi:hypothetical protein